MRLNIVCHCEGVLQIKKTYPKPEPVIVRVVPPDVPPNAGDTSVIDGDIAASYW